MPILDFGGRHAFSGGTVGAGVPSYTRARGYSPFFAPEKVGARYFFPEPEFDPVSDQAVPAAMGNIWDGGSPAYQERVYAAAKKVGKKQGLSKHDIDDLNPTPNAGHPSVGGGIHMNPVPFLAAPGAERPDFTIFNFPAANLVDGSAEEVELDQALSLAGRFGRDFLGMEVSGLLEFMATEHLTITTADHTMSGIFSLQTRTGAFTKADPEIIDVYSALQAVTAPTTATSEALNPVIAHQAKGEPFLYVAPRLFARFTNQLDATVTALDLQWLISSVSRRLTFRLFIELLERFADVTLL